MKVVNILFLLASVFAVNGEGYIQKEKCQKPNELWYPQCNAPKCEETCATWGEACDGTPREGCFCGNGYARDKSGNCILTELCKYSCTGRSEIQIALSAISGQCILRCTEEGVVVCDFAYPPSECSCMQGNVRSVDGDCIRTGDCKPQCPNP